MFISKAVQFYPPVQIKNGVSVKPAPFNKIGTSLVDGLVAFESTVKELEELCLAAVPPELRDVPPVKEGGVISDSWRRCLSPGLNRLQEEAENTKSKLIVLIVLTPSIQSRLRSSQRQIGRLFLMFSLDFRWAFKGSRRIVWSSSILLKR